MPGVTKTQTESGLPLLIVEGKEMGFLAHTTSVRSYVAESWRKSMLRDRLYSKQRGDTLYARINRILDSPLTHVYLALWPEGEAGELFVVGYLVTAPGAVHYAYVRERYRRNGVLKTLLAQAHGLICATHWSSELHESGKAALGACEFVYVGSDWIPQAESLEDSGVPLAG